MSAGYDDFAWLYDREWGATSLTFLPALDSLALNGLPAGSRILDLACGSGQLAAVLAGRGFHVTGVDNSAQMLELARARASRVDFVLADARSFSLPARFDAIVCVYDSLNHMLSTDELRKVFTRAYAALTPGGRFVFDLMTEAGYSASWHSSFVGDDHAAMVRSTYDQTTKTMRFTATLFRPSGDFWVRSDVVLTQRCHAESEVRAALEAAGFADVSSYPALDLGVRSAGRLFYAAVA